MAEQEQKPTAPNGSVQAFLNGLPDADEQTVAAVREAFGNIPAEMQEALFNEGKAEYVQNALKEGIITPEQIAPLVMAMNYRDWGRTRDKGLIPVITGTEDRETGTEDKENARDTVIWDFVSKDLAAITLAQAGVTERLRNLGLDEKQTALYRKNLHNQVAKIFAEHDVKDIVADGEIAPRYMELVGNYMDKVGEKVVEKHNIQEKANQLGLDTRELEETGKHFLAGLDAQDMELLADALQRVPESELKTDLLNEQGMGENILHALKAEFIKPEQMDTLISTINFNGQDNKARIFPEGWRENGQESFHNAVLDVVAEKAAERAILSYLPQEVRGNASPEEKEMMGGVLKEHYKNHFREVNLTSVFAAAFHFREKHFIDNPFGIRKEDVFQEKPEGFKTVEQLWHDSLEPRIGLSRMVGGKDIPEDARAFLYNLDMENTKALGETVAKIPQEQRAELFNLALPVLALTTSKDNVAHVFQSAVKEGLKEKTIQLRMEFPALENEPQVVKDAVRKVIQEDMEHAFRLPVEQMVGVLPENPVSQDEVSVAKCNVIIGQAFAGNEQLQGEAAEQSEQRQFLTQRVIFNAEDKVELISADGKPHEGLMKVAGQIKDLPQEKLDAVYAKLEAAQEGKEKAALQAGLKDAGIDVSAYFPQAAKTTETPAQAEGKSSEPAAKDPEKKTGMSKKMVVTSVVGAAILAIGAVLALALQRKGNNRQMQAGRG